MTALFFLSAEVYIFSMEINDIDNLIKKMKQRALELQTLLCAHEAIAPESGGTGEWAKANALMEWLRGEGFSTIDQYPAPDDRVPEKNRPNFVCTIPGKNEKRLWVMSHLDVVPPGEWSQWKTNPWEAKVKGDKIYGRGTEDNHQGIVSSILAISALMESGLEPEYTVKLLFVADEEVGSGKGIGHLVKHEDLFMEDDIVLVPDAGNPDGSMIEVAEKSILWMRFHVTGKQCHASRPDLGKNAMLASSDLILQIAALQTRYTERNELFDPPYATITPTKRQANVPNVNTLPGDDVFYVDMRIIPEITLERVQNDIMSLSRAIEEKYGVSIETSEEQKVTAGASSIEGRLYPLLKKAVKQVYKTNARPVGIGGGTLASFLRDKGIETIVWARLLENAHMPNEYALLSNIIGDARVMARLMLST